MAATGIYDDQWSEVLRHLPGDLDASARGFGVIERRREIRSGEDLMRMALWYGVGGLSLRDISARAHLMGLGKLSDVAVLGRLRTLGPWLTHVLGQMLSRRRQGIREFASAVELVDATTIEEPGGRSGERVWRLHVRLDPACDSMVHAELTDHHGGERLSRHDLAAGTIVVGDRVYGTRQGVAHAIKAGGHVVLRFSPCALPLETEDGNPIDIVEWAGTHLGPGELGERALWFVLSGTRYPVRVIVHRREAEAAGYMRKRARRKAQKGQYSVTETALRAAEYQFLVTDLPAERLSTQETVELYELRWRVELYFKRLKTLLSLGDLRAHDPGLVHTYLLASLIGGLVIEELLDRALPFPPSEQLAEYLAYAQGLGLIAS